LDSGPQGTGIPQFGQATVLGMAVVSKKGLYQTVSSNQWMLLRQLVAANENSTAGRYIVMQYDMRTDQINCNTLKNIEIE
jgi:hypothetical protein